MQVGGIIADDTTWDLAGSPHETTDNVIVPPGVTLTIEPGVVVNFTHYTHAIEVYGTLNATYMACGAKARSRRSLVSRLAA